MFVALYRMVVKPGRDEDFVRAWSELTDRIYGRLGSLGSRLHRSDQPRTYYAYAQWPSAERYDADHPDPPDDEAAVRTALRDAVEDLELVSRLEVLDDRLRSTTPPSSVRPPDPRLRPFFGVWVLDSGADSDPKPPHTPERGVYPILPDGDAAWFHVRWKEAGGGVHRVGFRARLDGAQAVPQAPGATLHAWIDDGDVLVTEVRLEGEAVHTAWRRRVGDRLEVRQRMLSDAGPVETSAHYVSSEVKQVLVYRRDLGMRKGKIAAQCAHASMGVFFRRDQGPVDRLEVGLEGPMAQWAKGRFAKVVLSVEGEAELLKIHELAESRGLPAALITDSGKTEFQGVPTRTVVAVGPAATLEIDEITGPHGLVATKLP